MSSPRQRPNSTVQYAPWCARSRSKSPTRVGGMSSREDGREDDELRPVTITRGFTSHPAGSVLVEVGETRVMCTASVTDGVPRWRKGSGQGWLTAEDARLPAATHT